MERRSPPKASWNILLGLLLPLAYSQLCFLIFFAKWIKFLGQRLDERHGSLSCDVAADRGLIVLILLVLISASSSGCGLIMVGGIGILKRFNSCALAVLE